MTAFNSESTFKRAPQQGHRTSKSMERVYSRQSTVDSLRPEALDLVLKPFPANPLPSLSLVRPAHVLPRREQAVEAAGLGDLRRNRRRDGLVGLPRLRFRDGTLGQPPDEELARAPRPQRARDEVPGPGLP